MRRASAFRSRLRKKAGTWYETDRKTLSTVPEASLLDSARRPCRAVNLQQSHAPASQASPEESGVEPPHSKLPSGLQSPVVAKAMPGKRRPSSRLQ